ncbi:MAG: hypothetical protein R6V01_03405 [Thermoplasmatota archaeon]
MRGDRSTIMLAPLLSVLAGSILLYLMFPNYSELSGWFQVELSSFPFLIWAALGAVAGFVVSKLLKKELYRIYSKRVKAGFFVWLLIAIVISSITEEGDLFDRLSQGPLFKAWAVIFLIVASSSPTYLGVLAVLTRKRTYIAGSVMMFFLIPTVCMIFSQASSASVLSQDPILSLLFVWSMISFVEGVNWLRRYVDTNRSEFPRPPSGKDMRDILWRRQISYTVIFLGVSSLIAHLPFAIPLIFDTSSMWFYSFYESSAVIGKAVVSLVVLVPLAILSFGRRYLDLRKAAGTEEEEEGDKGTF